jgi:hypothetical protein
LRTGGWTAQRGPSHPRTNCRALVYSMHKCTNTRQCAGNVSAESG